MGKQAITAGAAQVRDYRLAAHHLARPLPAGAFAQAHKDPFDRMLAAQALNRGLALVSNDVALDAFGVERVW